MAVKKWTRKEVAYNYLRNVIVSHEITPGSAIVEQEVSATLNISRTPIREAMKQLEAEGLLQTKSIRGAFVSEINRIDVTEIFDLRMALEMLALRNSIYKITEDEIHEVEALFLNLTENCSREKFYEADRHIHDLITNNCGNRRLVTFLANINSQIERFRYIAAMKPERLKHSRKEHEEILKYIKQKNLEKAEEALTYHINNVRESVMLVCEKQIMKDKT